MEVPEEFTGSNDPTLIVKGKRTKRPRPSSPSGVAVTSSSSTGGCGGGGSGTSGIGNGGGDVYSSIPSPTSSGENSTCTEEDEDMANCLILLAQGVSTRQAEVEEAAGKIEKSNSQIFTEMATTTTGKAGIYLYECKTCNRTFPSFQALGGHRASHKRPKTTVEEKKVLPMTPASDEEEEERQFNKISPPLSLQMAIKDSQINNKSKVHECSVCGSEFSSGQALGGHMRRHRAPPTARTAMSIDTSTVESHEESNKPRNILALDLNLPAPADDDNHRDSKFQFTPNKQHLVFSAPALVDCHY